MILQEREIPIPKYPRKIIIQELFGREVILKDFHERWCHGEILRDGCDDEVYQMKIADGRGQRQMHYDDLEVLLVAQRTQPDIDLIVKNT